MLDRSLKHHEDAGIAYRVSQRSRGWRLDDFLRERIPRLSREKIHEAIRTRITLSWKENPTPETIVQVGGDVHVGFAHVQETQIDPEIAVLYEDEFLYAVDKPPGLLVHPTSYCRKNAVTRILERKLGHKLYMVHRLDRATSGTFLLAKTKQAAQKLTLDFKERKIEKEYLAIVHGKVERMDGKIDTPLSKMYYTPEGIRRDPTNDADRGEPAVTEYRVEQATDTCSRIRLFPKTGRTHQLRVHLLSIGHPIVGDPLYAKEKKVGERLYLHSLSLEFSHPIREKTLRIESSVPEDFSSLMG